MEKDFSEAIKWFRLAAEGGCVDAQFHLGLIYETGLGTAENKEEAIKWYRRAAEQGHENAKHALKKVSPQRTPC